LFESVVKFGIHYTMLAKQNYFYPIQGATCSLLPDQLDYWEYDRQLWRLFGDALYSTGIKKKVIILQADKNCDIANTEIPIHSKRVSS